MPTRAVMWYRFRERQKRSFAARDATLHVRLLRASLLYTSNRPLAVIVRYGEIAVTVIPRK